MATISHEPSQIAPERRGWSAFLVREAWASLAISVIWLSVLFDAIYGPNIVTHSAGGDEVVMPSAVIVSGFAFLATWVVARYGLREHRD